MVSTAAATAASEDEFFARLDAAGMSIRRRYSTRNPGEVTGYAVALPADTTRTGGPVWYSGGKLAPDLTLPKLRHRWAASGDTSRDQFTAAERDAIWKHAAQAASRATAEIRQLAGTDPGGAADAAWAAADTLHAAASMLGSREMRRAADSYARAARVPYGRMPRHTRTGTRLRMAARLLGAATPALDDPALALILRLIALIEAVADMRARSATRRRPPPPARRRRICTPPDAPMAFDPPRST
jgi:hypothetical protein